MSKVHVEAEAAFAAVLATLVREAGTARSTAAWRERAGDAAAERMMLGTAEAYDWMSQHAEHREAPGETGRDADGP